MQVFRHVNSIFTSNTYLLSQTTSKGIYIVDPGSDSKEVLEWLVNNNKKKLSGIILTHAHHDHIYGINHLLEAFPNSKLYVAQKMISFLLSAKDNMSEYMGMPFTLNSSYMSNIELLYEESQLLLWNEVNVNVLFTPGHTIDSITFQIGDYVFSGDTLIPGKKVIYRRKSGGDSLDSINSIEKIYKTFNDDCILLPGHGSECSLSDSRTVKDFSLLNHKSNFIRIIHKYKKIEL